jgi:hypothetical protein
MADVVSRSFSARLRELTSELRPRSEFESQRMASGPALREFRQALDNIRLTAWTVSELQNAKQTSKDSQGGKHFSDC